jgi:hypothetical protein
VMPHPRCSQVVLGFVLDSPVNRFELDHYASLYRQTEGLVWLPLLTFCTFNRMCITLSLTPLLHIHPARNPFCSSHLCGYHHPSTDLFGFLSRHREVTLLPFLSLFVRDASEIIGRHGERKEWMRVARIRPPEEWNPNPSFPRERERYPCEPFARGSICHGSLSPHHRPPFPAVSTTVLS